MANLKRNHAVYCGTFDPPTLGHLDIIRRGSALFEKLTVGIGINPDKKCLFSPTERVDLLTEVVEQFSNVVVATFEGLSVDFVRSCEAMVILRGVRSPADMESEFTMSLANTALDSEIETVLLPASKEHSHISSTLVKQVARMSDGDPTPRLADFLPAPILESFVARVAPGR